MIQRKDIESFSEQNLLMEGKNIQSFRINLTLQSSNMFSSIQQHNCSWLL